MSKWLKNNPKDYIRDTLSEQNIIDSPLELFQQWFAAAYEHQPETANIMHLATVNARHEPNCRVVLLKSMDQDGFVFFTNYHSIKANELNCQPMACLNFFWFEQKRQVRIQGEVEKISSEESDAYFASRPRESQLGAWASDQSTEIPSREFLERRYQALEQQYAGLDVPRPPHWGGYLLQPSAMEFWQGGDKRLHDRFYYQRHDDQTWTHQRLAP